MANFERFDVLRLLTIDHRLVRGKLGRLGERDRAKVTKSLQRLFV
jgi:hypothetical protein